MLLKKDVLKSLKELPDEFSVDEAIDRLVLLHKKEISKGKGLSTEQAKKNTRPAKKRAS